LNPQPDFFNLRISSFEVIVFGNVSFLGLLVLTLVTRVVKCYTGRIVIIQKSSERRFWLPRKFLVIIMSSR